MIREDIESIINKNKLIYLYGRVGYGKTTIINNIFKNDKIIKYYSLGNNDDVDNINKLLIDLVNNSLILVIENFQKVINKENINIKLLDEINEKSKVIFLSRAILPKEFRRLLLNRKIQIIDLSKISISYDYVNKYLVDKNDIIEEELLKNIIVAGKNWPIAIDALISAVKINGGILNKEAQLLAMEVIFEYLDEKVFQELTYENQRFLLRLSLLEDFDLDLCTRVISNKAFNHIEESLLNGSFISKTEDEKYILNNFLKRFLERKAKVEFTTEEINEFYCKTINYYVDKELFKEAIKVAIKKDSKLSAIVLIEDLIKNENLNDNASFIAQCIEKINREDTSKSGVICAFMVMYNCLIKYNKLNIDLWEKKLHNTSTCSSILIHKLNLIKPFTKNKDIICAIKAIDICENKYKTYFNLSCNIPSILRGIRDFSVFNINHLNYDRIIESINDNILKASISLFYAEVLYEKNKLKESLRILSKATYISEASNSPVLYYISYILMIKLLFAEGKGDLAIKIIGNIEEFIKKNNGMFLMDNLKGSKVKLHIKNNNIKEIDNWINNNGIMDSMDVGVFSIYTLTIKARVYIYKGENMKALFILEKLLILFEECNRTIDKIENLVLQGIIYYNNSQNNNAYNIINIALNMAFRYGYIRPLADEGMKISQILKGYLKDKTNISLDMVKFIKQIIREANKVDIYCNDGDNIEDLTYMEEEVLKLLAKGLKYADIGQSLNIKLSTVKTHIYNIYSKLNVTSKSEAIILANKYYIKSIRNRE